MNDETITKLTELWYRTLVDHHKDRDCHWYIEKKWSYGNPPVYRVHHYGYILEEIDEEFPDYSAALSFLAKTLREAIADSANSWIEAAPTEVGPELAPTTIAEMNAIKAELAALP